jgi:hypothetical protein
MQQAAFSHPLLLLTCVADITDPKNAGKAAALAAPSLMHRVSTRKNADSTPLLWQHPAQQTQPMRCICLAMTATGKCRNQHPHPPQN